MLQGIGPEALLVSIALLYPHLGHQWFHRAADAGSRARYWHNLQRVWYLSSSWGKSYGFDLNSMSASLQASGARLERFSRSITGSSW